MMTVAELKEELRDFKSSMRKMVVIVVTILGIITGVAQISVGRYISANDSRITKNTEGIEEVRRTQYQHEGELKSTRLDIKHVRDVVGRIEAVTERTLTRLEKKIDIIGTDLNTHIKDSLPK